MTNPIANSSNADFPFSLRHFFEGALCREEVVSACLAMLLEGSAAFREHFFALIGDKQLMEIACKSWTIAVEKNQIDICLAHENTIVLIENKVAGASKQQGQLVRYYRQQRMESPHARIMAVMLAPSRIGMDEVERTRLSTEFVDSVGHFVGHVSWDDVLKLPEQFADVNGRWISNILSRITTVISRIREAKYELIGDRAVLSELVSDLQKRVQKTSDVRTMTDKREKTQEVYSVKNSFTMAVGFGFECSSEPPFEVHGISQPDGSLQLKVRSYFSLSQSGKKCDPAAKRWRDLATGKTILVSGIGDYFLQPNMTYHWEQQMWGSREEVVARMCNAWSCLERFAKEHDLLHAVT